MRNNLIIALTIGLLVTVGAAIATDIDLTPGQLPGPVNQILETAINSKPSKPTTATTNDLAYFDANDDLADSGILYTKVMQTPASAVTGNIPKFTATDQVDDSGIAYDTVMIEPAGSTNDILTLASTKQAQSSGVQFESTMTTGALKAPVTAAVLKVTDPVVAWIKNHADGFVGSAGSSGCTHDDSGAYDYNLDMSAGNAYVMRAGSDYEMQGFVSQVDYDLAHDSSSPPIQSGSTASIIYAVVAKNDAGTISLAKVAGTAAADVSVVAPSDATITASVGHAYWIRLLNIKVNASGATSCSYTLYNNVKPKL